MQSDECERAAPRAAAEVDVSLAASTATLALTPSKFLERLRARRVG